VNAESKLMCKNICQNKQLLCNVLREATES